MSELLINALESTTGWTATSGLVLSIQAFTDYIAYSHTNALAIKIPAGSLNKSATLAITTPITVSDYSELKINITSLKQESGRILRSTDAKYSLTIATAQEFFIPTSNEMTPVCIPVDGFTQVTKIQITIKHNEEDYILLSDFRAVKESLPSDILNAVKNGIEKERDRIVIDREIGTVTAPAGSKRVTISTDWSFLERNMVLKIGTKYHQIENIQDNIVSFKSTFDGDTLLISATSAKVYVSFPVEVGYYDRDAKLPGIVVWYSSPTASTRNSRSELNTVCVGPLGVYRKRDGLLQAWRVQLEIVARSPELQADAAKAARAFLSTSTVWASGHKLWFEWIDPAVDSEPVEAYDIVPRASYVFDVEAREDTWQILRTNLGSPVLTVTPTL